MSSLFSVSAVLLPAVRGRKLTAKRNLDSPQPSYDNLVALVSVTTMAVSSRPLSRDHDTGFPVSFASRSTSLRHPDAVIGPDATISADDIDPTRSLNRTRRSILRKHRRTTSHGKITIEMERQRTASDPAWGSIDDVIDLSSEQVPLQESDGRPSKDTDSTTQTDESTKGGHSPESPNSAQFESVANPSSPRRKSLFKKWSKHHH
jgi:hypothetical protein